MCEITKENDSLQRQTENKDEDSQKIQCNKNIPELRFPEFEGEWKKITLNNLAKIQRGASPRPISSNRWYDNENKKVGWVRIGDVTNSSRYLYRTEDYFSEEGIKKSRFLPKGSLIMSICATIGKPIITEIDTCIHDGFVGFSDLTNINKEFLYYILKNLENKFISLSQTGSQANLNTNLINKTKINMPSIKEQKKIANFLTCIDQKIELMEKKHTLYQSIKKYFLENLFPHDSKIPYLRLPMFSDEFKRFTLNELFISKKGKGLSKDKIQEDGENKCILYGELYTTYSQIISTIKSRTNIFEGVLSNKMDILMPCSTTTTGKDLATASVLLKENVLLGGDITILRKKKDILDEIYFAYYLSFCLNKTLTSLAQGSTIIHLYWNHIKNIEVLIPSKEEQIQIAKIIKLLDDKIEQSSLQINNLKDYKKGLLQKMFV